MCGSVGVCGGVDGSMSVCVGGSVGVCGSVCGSVGVYVW